MIRKLFSVLFVAILLVACEKDDTTPPVDNANVHLEEGLIAYYPFNGNIQDETGNNATGTILGGNLAYDEHGYANKCFSFPGNGSKIVVTNNGKLAWDTAFSISYHVMLRNFGRYVFLSLVDHNAGNAVSYISGTNTPGSQNLTYSLPRNDAPCNLQFLPTNVNPTIFGFSFQPESWYNVITTFNKGSMKLYVNGRLVASTLTGTNATRICPASQLIIGGWWKGDAEASMNGKLDEIRIYSRELNSDEINELAKHF